MPKNGNRFKWIEIGYRDFADGGPTGLHVNAMSQKVGLSRTSFYHHFGDVDEFIEVVLEYHEERGARYHEQLLLCQSYEPDFIELIIKEKDAFLFHRQLLVNRSESRYADCAARIDGTTVPHTFNLWSQKHGIQRLGDVAFGLFLDLCETWWLRIGTNSFEYDILKALDDEITRDLIRVLNTTKGRIPLAVNGRGQKSANA